MKEEVLPAVQLTLDYLEATNQHSLGILLEWATLGNGHPDLTNDTLARLYEELVTRVNYERGVYHQPPKPPVREWIGDTLFVDKIAVGYRAHFTGAYVCLKCGNLCECETE